MELTSKPMAKRKLRMIAAAIASTGMAVESIPRPTPLMMTVAGPVAELSASFWVGRYECEV